MGQLTREVSTSLLTWALIAPEEVTIQPTMPIMVRLMKTAGTADVLGTEVTGELYDEQDSQWAITTLTPGATAINVSDVTYDGISETETVTVTGVELWDSSDEPIRIAFANLSSPYVVAPNTSFSIGRGQIKVKIL